MVDLVVDIVANLVDNRGGGDSNWGSMSIGGNSWGGMSISGNSWGGVSISGNSWGGMSNSGNSGSSIGSNGRSSDSVTSSIDTSNEAMSIGGNTSYKAMSSKELSISISNWGSKATGN